MLPVNVFNGFLSGLLYSILSFVIVVLLYLGSIEIQQKYYPILDDVYIQYIKDEENLTNITLYFNKNYNCYPILHDFSWYVSREVNGSKYFDRIYFEIPTAKGSISRPTGKNVSENWLIGYSLGLDDFNKAQKIIFSHNCLGFINIKTVINIQDIDKRLNLGF